jgi:hypothetical protein
MKTERRHDLEANSLAIKLANWIESIKPYTNTLLGVAAALVAVTAISSMMNSRSAATEESAWAAYAQAKNSSDPELENLRKLTESEEFAGTRMQEWAHLTWADRQVLAASRIYLRDRGAAEDRLRGARGIYETFAADARDEQIRDRSHFGLGRVFEMLNKVDEAQREYALVQGDLQPIASQRAELLQADGAKETCNWLASAELPKPDITGGKGASGERPGFDVSLPSANSTTSAEESDPSVLQGFAIGDSATDSRKEELNGDEEAAAEPAEEQESAGE